jgi:hypothetical protein
VNHWGKAGQRLTNDQRLERARARQAKALVSPLQGSAVAERDVQVYGRKWRHGLLAPAAITMLLDSQDLEGPAVDVACGAVEPEVDLWERGVLYPTFEQCVLVARLANAPVGALFDWSPMPWESTTMRFHHPRPPPPLLQFTREAVETRTGRAQPHLAKVTPLRRQAPQPDQGVLW